jgi:ectoine hydroxylase-related dioxygenase (phytanoyl-CoA dioxygenase family)
MNQPLTRREQWETEGFLVVPGLLADTVDTLAREASRLAARSELIHGQNIRCRWADHVDTRECRFDCFDPVIDLSAELAAIARDPRLLQVLAELYGEPAQLFKDKLIYKPPGAPGYDLHQDYIAWEGFPRSFVTAIVAIDPSDAAAGGTEFFPGTQRLGLLSPPDGAFHRLAPALLGDARGVIPALQPGDVVVFGGLMPHRSAPNRSACARRLLYLSYNAASDGGDQRDAHYRQFHAWLRERYAEHGKLGVYFR